MAAERTETSDTSSRYVVGIDLGTTNSAVAYVDTTIADWRVETFAVPQLVAPGLSRLARRCRRFIISRLKRNSPLGRYGYPGTSRIPTMPSVYSPANKAPLRRVG